MNSIFNYQTEEKSFHGTVIGINICLFEVPSSSRCNEFFFVFASGLSPFMNVCALVFGPFRMFLDRFNRPTDWESECSKLIFAEFLCHWKKRHSVVQQLVWRITQDMKYFSILHLLLRLLLSLLSRLSSGWNVIWILSAPFLVDYWYFASSLIAMLNFPLSARGELPDE